MKATIEAMYAFWAKWFAQSAEEKEKLSKASGRGGWYPPFSEAPGYTGKPDPKEYYHFRTKDLGLDSSTAAVFEDCYDKARAFLFERGLLPALDFPRDLCVLRVLHYLPTPDGCSGQEHRDFDLLTVNVGGTCPGLEVYGPDPIGGEFYPREGGIHVGEMLEIYTSSHFGQCPSTEKVPPACACDTDEPERPCAGDRHTVLAVPHRVRIPPNTERYAAVFFYLPPMPFELRPGFTAHDYLLGPNGVLVKAGTAAASKVTR